ncbi:hypothetical protein NHX12_009349 [Muraenolepis orangiensis]|uniref:Uncharacterized protein n=1 Tax=Muraenolepis orangiensis TaxID=630683 RepID=A0A9Q0DN51_9TELE|nr:hypothetical protein NHX12_009349 [Muraenolepis orangiensis]
MEVTPDDAGDPVAQELYGRDVDPEVETPVCLICCICCPSGGPESYELERAASCCAFPFCLPSAMAQLGTAWS